MAPWQTVVHDLRRTYCETTLATLECWCPEERAGCWEWSQEGAARPLQVHGPTNQHLWPSSTAGQGGQEAGTSSAPTGQGSTRASCSGQHVANGKQALTDAHSCCQNRSALHFEASNIQGQSDYGILLHSWEKLLPGSPAGWQPLSPAHLISQQASTYSLPVCQRSCTRCLWLHSLVFHLPLTVSRKGNKAHLSPDCGYIVL